jgi:hypothetical protein
MIFKFLFLSFLGFIIKKLKRLVNLLYMKTHVTMHYIKGLFKSVVKIVLQNIFLFRNILK